MIIDIPVDYFRTPLNKYTFSNNEIREWVEQLLKDKYVLNLYSGPTILNLKELRNDIDNIMNAHFHMDARNCCEYLISKGYRFDGIILDPPYSNRKSMEFYNGYKKSKFAIIKQLIRKLIEPNGIVITFGYNSNNMGKNIGFELKRIGLFCHNGAIHDTIASVEQFIDK